MKKIIYGSKYCNVCHNTEVMRIINKIHIFDDNIIHIIKSFYGTIKDNADINNDLPIRRLANHRRNVLYIENNF